MFIIYTYKQVAFNTNTTTLEIRATYVNDFLFKMTLPS